MAVSAAMGSVDTGTRGEELTGFGADETLRWRPINDGVMGGLSSSDMTAGEDVGVFAGEVSLANNGGFASVRAAIGRRDLSAFEGIAIRARGDGKRYRLRLHAAAAFDGVAYQAEFETEAGRWLEIELPFDAFRPTFRGRTPRGAGPLDTSRIEQLGLMIADRQAGPFRLEVDWIRAYGAAGAGRQE